MKNFYLLLFIVLSSLNLSAQCNSGLYESYAILSLNGSNNVYYDLNANTANLDFEGANLGNFCAGSSSLILNGAQNEIFKCYGADIFNGKVHYRVYKQGALPGSFIDAPMSFLNGWTSGLDPNCQDQQWEINNANVNLLAPLTEAGTYNVEIYTTADYQFCGNGTHFANNSGANYKAQFYFSKATASVNKPMPICAGSDIILNGSGADNYLWNNGAVPNNTPFTIFGTTTYTLTGIDALTSCTSTELFTVTATNGIGQMSNHANLSSNICGNFSHQDGQIITYKDGDCKVLATIFDAPGGNVLGNTSVCVDRAANTNLFYAQPYVPRVYSITPSSNGPADIKLYFTNQDFLDYNTNAAPFNLINTQPAALLANGDKISLCITKINGTDTTSFPSSLTWSSALQQWSADISVPDLSKFYCHVCNPLNTPLSLSKVLLVGKNENQINKLSWQFNNQNIAFFSVFKSVDNQNFKLVTQLDKYATSFDDDIVYPLNYYKLEAHLTNGTILPSNPIKIVNVTNSQQSIVYPNPAKGFVDIFFSDKISNQATVEIYALTGQKIYSKTFEVLQNSSMFAIQLSDVPSGVYQLKIIAKSSMESVKLFIQ
jgi:hypothetical protein